MNKQADGLMKKVNHHGIRTKMIVYIMLITAVEFICASIFISGVYRNSNINKAHMDNTRAIKNIEIQLMMLRERANSFMQDVQGNEESMNAVYMLNTGRLDQGTAAEYAKIVRNYMNRSLLLNDDLFSSELHVAKAKDEKIIVYRGISYTFWDEFDNVHMEKVLEKAGKMYVFVPTNTNLLAFSRAQPIIQDHRIVDYYCINVIYTQSRINQILRQNMSDKSRQAMIMDADGKVYNCTSTALNGQTAERMQMNSRGNGECTALGEKWVCDMEYVDPIEKYVCVMQKMSTIDLTNASFIGNLRIIVLAMLLMGTLLAILISKWINRPIQELTSQFASILNDTQKPPLRVSGKNELNQVAEGINAVLRKQEVLIRDNYRNKILEKNARIELLQVQINPHFVFNTLDIINWFVYENRNEDARKVLVALGEMMRYSTYRYNSFVPFSEEIKQIRNYLHIQFVRYDGSFDVDIDIEEGLDVYMIPCLIIQPIIENAVKYGVTCKDSRGCVTLSAVRSGDEIVITVFDDGPGMTPEQVRHALDTDSTLESSTHGIGLRNVNQRMMLLFGPQYAIDVQTELGYYTQVTIRLPIRKNMENDGQSDSQGV